jgi:hypothetical protein
VTLKNPFDMSPVAFTNLANERPHFPLPSPEELLAVNPDPQMFEHLAAWRNYLAQIHDCAAQASADATHDRLRAKNFYRNVAEAKEPILSRKSAQRIALDDENYNAICRRDRSLRLLTKLSAHLLDWIDLALNNLAVVDKVVFLEHPAAAKASPVARSGAVVGVVSPKKASRRRGDHGTTAPSATGVGC